MTPRRDAAARVGELAGSHQMPPTRLSARKPAVDPREMPGRTSTATVSGCATAKKPVVEPLGAASVDGRSCTTDAAGTGQPDCRCEVRLGIEYARLFLERSRRIRRRVSASPRFRWSPCTGGQAAQVADLLVSRRDSRDRNRGVDLLGQWASSVSARWSSRHLARGYRGMLRQDSSPALEARGTVQRRKLLASAKSWWSPPRYHWQVFVYRLVAS